jgi:hypothetical protein
MKTMSRSTWAIAIGLTLTAGSAWASSPEAQSAQFALNVSATIETEITNYTTLVTTGSGTNKMTNTVQVAKTRSEALGNTQIYELVSNAVAQGYVTGVPATDLPDAKAADIAFNAEGTDGKVSGTFYVTNKSGFYYPLSGFDTSSNYYSYMELDDDDYGFRDTFDGVFSGSFDLTTFSGTQTETEPMLLYVHDNPYAFDDADTRANFWDFFENAIELRTSMHLNQTFDEGVLTHKSMSSLGNASGNAMINGHYGAVTSGHVSFSP